jgi:hypothetical protein
MRRLTLLLLVVALAACKRRQAPAAEAPDAAPAEILTPGGRVRPEEIKKEVEETLEKEHERTLDPKVE